MKKMSYETYRKEIAKMRGDYINFVIGGYRKSEKDFFHNDELLEEIYTLNKEFLIENSSVYDIKNLLRRINYDSKENRLKSISLNLSLDLNEMKINLPKNFNIRPSNLIHPENIHQLSILYNESKNSSDNDLWIASTGFYLLAGKEQNKFIINSIQGQLKYPEKDKIIKKRGSRIFGKLNSFYKEDWRVGIIKGIKDLGEKKNLEVFGKMPPIFYLFGSSTAEYPLYSTYNLLSFLKADISLDNILFENTPIDFKSNWNSIIPKIREEDLSKGILSLENLSREYRKFYSNQKNLWLSSGEIKLNEFEKNCREKADELMNSF